MTEPLLFRLFILLSLIALSGLGIALANPYQLRWRMTQTVSAILPTAVTDDIRTLGQRWAGGLRLTGVQLRLLSVLGIAFGGMLGLALSLLLEPVLAVGVGCVVAVLGALYPQQRYEAGFSRPFLQTLEHEAAVLAGFAYLAYGVAGMPLGQVFVTFKATYPETETAKLLAQLPPGVAPEQALLSLGLPAQVRNWRQVIETLAGIREAGNPEQILLRLRDRMQEAEVEYQREQIDKKANQAVVATVMLVFPALMVVVLGVIIIQAARAFQAL